MALAPFEVLYEADLPAYKLPVDLQHMYGRLGFPTPVLYSNFVSSVDGVVALGSTPSAGPVINGKHPPAPLPMGRLPAFPAPVLLGAGTRRATPPHLGAPAPCPPHLPPPFPSAPHEL